MPASTPDDSSGSPPPSSIPSSSPDAATSTPRWRVHVGLFAATIASVFVTGMVLSDARFGSHASVVYGVQFAASLLGILTVHEAGHYVAARIHHVDASPPYFIPLPFLGFGTMGAVIRMRGTIPTRRALLDIGASGPLAGLAVAIPLYAWGVAHSAVVVVTADMGQVGSSLLVRLLERLAAPHVPEGMDLFLSPVAFGAWAGLFVTMINLIPVGQLDGGHVAFALFGPRQNKLAVLVHRSMLAFFFVSTGSFVARDVRSGLGLHHLGNAVGNSLFWLVWFEMLAILGTLSARGQGAAGARAAADGLPIRTRAFATVGLVMLASVGREKSTPLLWAAWFAGLGLLLAMEVKSGILRPNAILDHPPTGSAPLDRVRVVIAIVTLAFFALLFMPTPLPL
jgi:membrane-associated protease RseP (regulator of RpoE activity)